MARGWLVYLNGREVGGVYFTRKEDADRYAAEIRQRQPEAKLKVVPTGKPGKSQGSLL